MVFMTGMVCRSLLGITHASEPPSGLTLWYDKPAARWLEALPVGNGRIACMVFGGVESERLQLNEVSVWSGSPQDSDNPEALTALPEIRQLLLVLPGFQWQGSRGLRSSLPQKNRIRVL